MPPGSHDFGPYCHSSALTLVRFVERCIELLLRALNVLPAVDADGHSDCSFARQLYEEKNARASELRATLPALYEYQRAANEQIERLRRNQVTVADDADRLKGEEARGQYCKAADDLEVELNEEIATLRQLQQKIDAAKKVLSDASARNWPGGATRESERSDAATTTPQSARADSDTELGNVLALDAER